jgi:hypothetical protein
MRIKPGTLIALNPQLFIPIAKRIPSFTDWLLYYGPRKECSVVQVSLKTVRYLKGTP